MKINEKLIQDIFNHKISIKKETDKKKLSSYIELIPMYDIYTQNIYPIKKENLHRELMENHYRFVNNEVKRWIEINYDKYKTRVKKLKGEDKIKMDSLIDRYKHMLNIISNYNIDTLTETSYKALFKYSSFGLTISICKRNSFHPYILYLKPYYTKVELVKLGQNMGKLNKDFKPEQIIEDTYDICKYISNNDVSFDEIRNHTLTIIKNKSISDICLYSFIGASLINRFLRNQKDYTINTFFYNRLKNIVNTIKTTPALERNYQLYRFIGNDDFIADLKIGDTFSDPAFLSTTRDPFYSPGLAGNFGLILVKINLKNIKSEGLFMEHFSLFPKEEEYLLPPNTKLKLISKDDHFKYYHINSSFEKIIHKKYEFDLIYNDYSWLNKIKIVDKPVPTFEGFIMSPKSRLESFQLFKSNTNAYNQIKINGFIFSVYYFDSTSSYSKFYYNKVEKGLSLIHFDENGYPLLFIEMGRELILNYINQYYFYNEKKDVSEKNIIDILTYIGKTFSYKKATIYHNYKNFVHFKNNYFKSDEMFLYINHYNDTLYNYIKSDVKRFSFEPFYEDKLDEVDFIINNQKNPDDIKKKLIESIEKDFHFYSQFIKLLEIDTLNYGTLNIYEKLLSEGILDFMADLDYIDELNRDDNLELIYRQPIRRGIN